MNISDKVTKIVNSPKLSTALFIATGVGKTYYDYKNAHDKYKRQFLINDTVVLAGSMAGMMATPKINRSVINNKYVQNSMLRLENELKQKIVTQKLERPLGYAKEIITNTLMNFSLFLFGILGALGADYILSKLKIDPPESEIETPTKKHGIGHKIYKKVDKFIDKFINKDTKEAIYSRVSDMPQMQIFASAVISSQALDLAKEKNSSKKIKHTTRCLINNSLVPMFFLSVSNVFTSGMKLKYKVPIMFASLVGGTLLVNAIGNKIAEYKDK